MMDFEAFAKHWERAVNGLTGRITNEKNGQKIAYTRREINDMWQEELLAHRFCSVDVRDEAQVFLDDLFDRKPDTAKRLLDKLKASRLNLGIETETVVAKGAGAVFGTVVAAVALNQPKVNAVSKAAGWIATAGGLASAASAVADVSSASRQPIIRSIREEARKQLEEYRALLSD